MSAINKLSTVTALSSGDLVALFSNSNGTDVAATLATLVAFIQSSLTTGDKPIAQYAAPNATGFSVTITPVTTGADVWLLLTPAAGYAAGTIVLPASPVEGQEIEVTCTQSVTTLTVSLNGAAAAYGAPSTLAANAIFRMRYVSITNAWYLIP